MAPSKSPETRTSTVTPTPPVRAEEDPRGIKRKAEDEPAKSTSNVVSKENPSPHRVPVPPPATTNSQAAPSNQSGTTSQQQAPGAQPPNRYSIYGPTNRDSMLAGPTWSSLSQRYQSITAARRDPSPAQQPSVPASAAPKPNTPSTASLDPPRRPSPDSITARDRFYPPSTVGGYNHYAMGRRELQEHREQLREGKRWLDGMLLKTEKLLQMVENKMALAGDGSGLAGPTQARKDELEFEERERNRQREMRRIEEEREKDRQEREKRERERLSGLSPFGGLFGREGRPFMGMGSQLHGGPPPKLLDREKSEAERNRDLLLSSRKVSAISPNEREREKEKEREREKAKESATVAAVGGDKDKKAGWNGESILGGTGLPRRDPGLGRGFGRGLWSFDVRG